ncbi:MAG TPA: MIP/aquaporin family protein [Verrucomicrobiae bacterium]|nr:MIP/aquaporin family protein [Verrucomicrobiae bacterium]
MGARCFGEFIGTAVLILLGDGVVANVLLKKSKAAGSGWLAIAAGWAFAVVFGVFAAIACGSPDAALNPAVTFGLAVETGDFSKFLPFLVAQLLGAMLGALLVWLHFLPHWAETEDPGVKLGCFSTMPAIRNFGANLLSEIIGTFVLLLGVAAIFSKKVAIGGPAAGLGPYLVGVLVWAIGLSLGGTTGYAINPARDLGPRIVHSLLPLGKKMGSGWDYAAVPVAGPLIGAGLAGLFVRMAHL